MAKVLSNGKIQVDVQTERPLGHGNTPAAWALVALVIFGAAVASVGAVVPSTVVIVIGVVIMAAGCVAGFVMKKAGYGAGGHKLKPSSH